MQQPHHYLYLSENHIDHVFNIVLFIRESIDLDDSLGKFIHLFISLGGKEAGFLTMRILCEQPRFC